MQRKISLWLLPAEEDRADLQKVIDQLAEKRNTLPFSPHLTLYSPIIMNPEILREEMEEICQGKHPLQLESAGLGHGGHFYRAVVMEINSSSELMEWNQQIRQRWNPEDARTFAPHVSLLYEEIEASARLAIVDSLDCKKVYHFDRLCAMATETSDSLGHQYEEWEHLWTIPLSVRPLSE